MKTPKRINKNQALYFLVIDLSKIAGKARISLLFEDGDCKESGIIILSCNRNEFKNLLESIVMESRNMNKNHQITCQE